MHQPLTSAQSADRRAALAKAKAQAVATGKVTKALFVA